MIGIFFVNRRLFLSFRILSNQPRNLNVKWWRCDRNVAISIYLLKQAWIVSLVSTQPFLIFVEKRCITWLHCIRRPLTYPTPKSHSDNECWMDDKRYSRTRARHEVPFFQTWYISLPPTPGHTNLYSAQRWANAIKKYLPTSNAWPADPSWGSGHPY